MNGVVKNFTIIESCDDSILSQEETKEEPSCFFTSEQQKAILALTQ